MFKFKIDTSFIILCLVLFLSPMQSVLIKLMLCLFLHELGHLWMLLIYKIKIKKLTLYAFGFSMELEDYSKIWWKDLTLYGAGIFINLVCYLIIPDSTIKMVSLYLFCFNLLPIYPLDGSNLLKVISEFFISVYYAFICRLIISSISFTILIVLLVQHHADLFIYFNLIYLLYLNVMLFKNRKIQYAQFLLYRYLHPLDSPVKSFSFHASYEKFFFRYHHIKMKLQNKQIDERKLLDLYFQKK